MRTLLFAAAWAWACACACALAACASAPPAAASGSSSAAGPMPAAAAAPLACGKVIDHVVGLMPAGQDAPQDSKDKLAGALSQACEQDAWSDDAKACLMAATTHDAAMNGCHDKLTQAQMDGAMHRVQTAMGGAMPGAAAPPASDAAAPDAAPPPALEAEPASAPPPPPAPAAPAKKASKPRRAQPMPKSPGKDNGDPCDGSE